MESRTSPPFASTHYPFVYTDFPSPLATHQFDVSDRFILKGPQQFSIAHSGLNPIALLK